MLPHETYIACRKLAVVHGVSLEQVNYRIKALGDEVYVKVGNFVARKNKFGYTCLLAPAGVAEMVTHDLAQAKQHALLKVNGYSINVSVE